jgi:hypothetical protein
MPIRTTYSLDAATVEAIRTLAHDWGLSQAGVVRRAVREARQHYQPRLTPHAAIGRLRAGHVPMQASDLQRIADELRHAREDADAARP